MSPPFRGREAVVPFVTGCHGEQLTIGITEKMIPVGKEASLSTWAGKYGGKIWKDKVSWLENWETATSTVYIPFAYIAYDCATSPFIRRSICILPRLAHDAFVLL